MNRTVDCSMFKLIPLIAIVLLSGCVTTDNPKLSGDRANIYVGGVAGQKVTGDGTNVSVFNIWKGEDGLPLAEQYCARFGKKLESNYSFQGITGYYQCGNLDDTVVSAIFDQPNMVSAASALSECVRTNVALLDDLMSDASTIATAVSQSCLSELDNLATLYISHLPNSQALDDGYKNSIKSAFEDGKADRVLPYVLAWRRLVNRGWDKQNQPTEKELPDSLFPKGI